MENNADAWDSLYKMYRSEFLNWLRKKGVCYEDSSDLYQESFVVLYENAISGVLSSWDLPVLKSYLFAVGKNKLFTKFRNEKKKSTLIFEYAGMGNEAEDDMEMEFSDRQQKIKEEVGKMKDPCKSILLLYYYEKKSMKEIAETLNYSTANEPKTQKSRCLAYLKRTVLF
jgi:RNA polymerase sigma factor (sigma-70 family)